MRKLLHKIHFQINEKIKHRFPTLSYYFYTKPRHWRHWLGKNEPKVYNGQRVSNSDRSSVLLFTTHKGASTFLGDQLKKLAQGHGICPIDFEGYLVSSNRKREKFYQSTDLLQKAFDTKGYCFSPLRYFIAHPHLDDFRIVLMLRDPRDVLTSQYYSVAFMHPVMNTNHLKNKHLAQKRSIDAHVLHTVDRFNKVYSDYVEHLLDRPNVLFIRYEDMIQNFDLIFRKIALHTGLTDNKELLENIISQANFTAEKGLNHKRNVQPGEHKEKLQKETIQILNQKLAFVLDRLGYFVD